MDMSYSMRQEKLTDGDGVEQCASDDEGDSDLGDETGVCVNDHYILARGQEAHAGPVGFPWVVVNRRDPEGSNADDMSG